MNIVIFWRKWFRPAHRDVII